MNRRSFLRALGLSALIAPMLGTPAQAAPPAPVAPTLDEKFAQLSPDERRKVQEFIRVFCLQTAEQIDRMFAQQLFEQRLKAEADRRADLRNAERGLQEVHNAVTRLPAPSYQRITIDAAQTIEASVPWRFQIDGATTASAEEIAATLRHEIDRVGALGR